MFLCAVRLRDFIFVPRGAFFFAKMLHIFLAPRGCVIFFCMSRGCVICLLCKEFVLFFVLRGCIIFFVLRGCVIYLCWEVA